MARSLDVPEHPATRRRIESAQGIGIVVLWLLLLAALAGLLGAGGPLAEATTEEGGLEVTSPRFARYLAPVRMEIRTDRVVADTVAITVEGEFARAFAAETIEPRPVEVAAAGDALVYRFAAVPGRPHEVRIDGQMETIGPVTGAVRSGDAAAVAIRAFVYP